MLWTRKACFGTLGPSTEHLPGGAPVQRALLVIGVVAAIVGGGRFLIRPVFRYLANARLHEILRRLRCSSSWESPWQMQKIGLSPALGTFLAGVVLAESEYRHELESDIEPFKGLLLGLFFISVGASIDLHLIQSQPRLIVSLVVTLLLVIVELVKKYFPNLQILARAKGRDHAYRLLSLGVQNIFQHSTFRRRLGTAKAGLKTVRLANQFPVRAQYMFNAEDDRRNLILRGAPLWGPNEQAEWPGTDAGQAEYRLARLLQSRHYLNRVLRQRDASFNHLQTRPEYLCRDHTAGDLNLETVNRFTGFDGNNSVKLIFSQFALEITGDRIRAFLPGSVKKIERPTCDAGWIGSRINKKRKILRQQRGEIQADQELDDRASAQLIARLNPA